MAQNGSKMEVAMVEVAAEVVVVLMALNQIARMVISSFFPGESKNSILKNFLFYFKNPTPSVW